MEYEAVTIGGKDEGDAERGGVFEALLEAVAHAMGIVLRFDDGERDIGLVVEDVVGALGFAAAHQFAAHNDPALGEAEFLADLQHFIPAGLAERGGDEFGADVAFGEGALVHGIRVSGWAGRGVGRVEVL